MENPDARDPEASPYAQFRKAGVIFVHVPKTAGLSMRAALFGSDVDQLDIFPHRSAELIRRIDPNAYAELLSFAVLRDPAARLVSAFNFLRGPTTNERGMEFAARYLTGYCDFAEFVEAIRDKDLWSKISAWPHFRPQCEFVTDLEGNLIVDLLICLEHLDAGVEELSAYLGRQIEVGKTNASKQRGDEHVPPDLLQQIYGDDLALWTWVQQAKFRWVSPRERYIRSAESAA